MPGTCRSAKAVGVCDGLYKARWREQVSEPMVPRSGPQDRLSGCTIKITPFGRTITLDRRIPSSRYYIQGTQAWAYRLGIHRGI